MSFKQRESARTEQVPKLVGRMELAKFVELTEKEFAQLIKGIEGGPLFQKLFNPPRWTGIRVISYWRFPRTRLSSSFYELEEELISHPEGVNIESLLSRYKEVLSIARKIGLDKFSRYFLYNQSVLSVEEIADECELTTEEVKKTYDLIDDLGIHGDLFHPSTITYEPFPYYSKVGRIEIAGDEWVIAYFSPTNARGRYRIDYQKLQVLKSQRVFTSGELKRVDKLIKKLEIVNTRQTIVWQILDKAIKHQQFYLKTGDPLRLIPLSQKNLSIELRIHSSLICRGISRRSIETPQGEEIPIKKLFPSKKKVTSQLVNQIIAQANKSLSAQEIKQELAKRFDIQISRRSVNNYRRELKMPSSFKRKSPSRGRISKRCVIRNQI